MFSFHLRSFDIDNLQIFSFAQNWKERVEMLYLQQYILMALIPENVLLRSASDTKGLGLFQCLFRMQPRKAWIFWHFVPYLTSSVKLGVIPTKLSLVFLM